jgi:hypothetical protein
MTVYRIENKEGIGPFKGSGLSGSTLGWCDYENHPSPYFDSIISDIWTDSYHLFFVGCESLTQLKNWFPYRRLVEDLVNNKGFSIKSIEVSSAHIGRAQVIFKKEDILSETTMTVDEFYKAA